MKKKILAVGLLAMSLIATTISGCGAADGGSGQEASGEETAQEEGSSGGEKLKVGAATRTLQDSIYITMRDNAQKKADELGIDLTWQDCNIDVAVQKSQIENFVAAGTDVMIVEAADQKSMSDTVTSVQ